MLFLIFKILLLSTMHYFYGLTISVCGIVLGNSTGRFNSTLEVPFFFNALNKIALKIYSEIPDNKFVALFPWKQNLGGFGNVIHHFMSVQGVGLATSRHSIFNHAIILQLFCHPVPVLTSSWSQINNSVISKIHSSRVRGYRDLVPCGQVAKYPLSRWTDAVFVHGCFGNNLMHPEIRPILFKLFETKYPVVVFAGLMQWTYSNPTSSYVEATANKIANISRQCFRNTTGLTSDVIDLVIQIRTLRDVGENLSDIDHLALWKQTNHCKQYINCSLHGIKQALHRKANVANAMVSSQPLCVYITSDNKAISFFLKSQLLGAVPGIAVVADGELPSLNNSDWQSAGIMNSNHLVSDEGVLRRSDLLDWMVISKAVSAVYLESSTFADTARLRAGYFAARHDYVVTTKDNPQCNLRIDREELCDFCGTLGSRCALDVRADCRIESDIFESNGTKA